MKILFLSSVFPNAIEPSRGCFNDSLVRALAIGHQVEVVSPIPSVDLVRGYRRGLRVPMYQRIADRWLRGPLCDLSLRTEDLSKLVLHVLLVVDCGDGPVVDPDVSPGADHQLLGAS